MELSELNKKYPYETVIERLRNPDADRFLPSDDEVKLKQSTPKELFQQLRTIQIQLVKDMAPGPRIKEWGNDRHQTTHYPHHPQKVAKRFILEYIRYSNICGLDKILNAVEEKKLILEEPDYIFAMILQWLSAMTVSPREEIQPMSLHEWLSQNEVTTDYFTRHGPEWIFVTNHTIAGTVLDYMLIPLFIENNVTDQSVNAHFQSLLPIVQYSMWVNDFLKYGTEIINNIGLKRIDKNEEDGMQSDLEF